MFKLRAFSLSNDDMVRVLASFGTTDVFTNDAAPLMKSHLERHLGRKIEQVCVAVGLRWEYMGWLTDDEWVFVKMKCL